MQIALAVESRAEVRAFYEAALPADGITVRPVCGRSIIQTQMSSLKSRRDSIDHDSVESSLLPGLEEIQDLFGLGLGGWLTQPGGRGRRKKLPG
jgi:hypothetical protein